MAIIEEKITSQGNGGTMTESSGTVAVVKGQLAKFSGIIAKGLSRPKRKLIKEMLYGIQASKDIKLSSISRSLHEPIALIKTENRLSHNPDDRDFTETINHEICRLAGAKIKWNVFAKSTMAVSMR